MKPWHLAGWPRLSSAAEGGNRQALRSASSAGEGEVRRMKRRQVGRARSRAAWPLARRASEKARVQRRPRGKPRRRRSVQEASPAWVRARSGSTSSWPEWMPPGNPFWDAAGERAVQPARTNLAPAKSERIQRQWEKSANRSSDVGAGKGARLARRNLAREPAWPKFHRQRWGPTCPSAVVRKGARPPAWRKAEVCGD